MSISDRFADAALTHAVNLDRFSEGMAKRVTDNLKELEVELTEKLKRVLDGTVPRTRRQTTRLERLLIQTSDTIKGKFRNAKNSHIRELSAFSKVESDAVLRGANKIIGADIANVTLTPGLVKELSTGSMVRGAVNGDWWAKQSVNYRDRFAQEIRLGMSSGEGIEDMVRRVRGKGTGKYRKFLIRGKRKSMQVFSGGIADLSTREARALVRTSVATVSNNIRYASYLANSDIITSVQALVTLDGRTTQLCMGRSGAVWSLAEGGPAVANADESFPGPPPWHWNCRSTLIPVTKSWEELGMSDRPASEIPPPSTQSSMDGQVAGNLRYADWLKTKPARFQRDVLGPSRWKLWRSGKMTELRDLTDFRGRTLTLAQLAEKLAAKKLKKKKVVVRRKKKKPVPVPDEPKPDVKKPVPVPDKPKPAVKKPVPVPDEPKVQPGEMNGEQLREHIEKTFGEAYDKDVLDLQLAYDKADAEAERLYHELQAWKKANQGVQSLTQMGEHHALAVKFNASIDIMNEAEKVYKKALFRTHRKVHEGLFFNTKTANGFVIPGEHFVAPGGIKFQRGGGKPPGKTTNPTKAPRTASKAEEWLAKTVKDHVGVEDYELIQLGPKGRAWASPHGQRTWKNLYEADLLPKGSPEREALKTTFGGKGAPVQRITSDRTVALSGKDGVEIGVHEIGHLLEEANEKWQERVHKFLVVRIDEAMEKAGKFAPPGPEVTGFDLIKAKNATWGDKAREFLAPINWKGNEFGWEDEFFSKYIGRFYGRNTGTEVTSMGLQALFENPIKFARVDPEMFELMVNLSRGRYDLVDDMAFMKRAAKIDAPARINSLEVKNTLLPFHK